MFDWKELLDFWFGELDENGIPVYLEEKIEVNNPNIDISAGPLPLSISLPADSKFLGGLSFLKKALNFMIS